MDTVYVDSVQKIHMKVDVQIERTSEALDERNCTGLCRGFMP